MHNYILLLAVILNTCCLSWAGAVEFQEHNCAIEFPEGWQILNPPPTQTLAGAQSPDGLKTIVFMAVKIPKSERAAANRDAVAGAKQSAIDKGWKIVGEHPLELGGIPFNSISTKASDTVSMASYFGLGPDELYVMQSVFKGGDADADSELQSIVHSFRLLPPVAISAGETESAAYRVGNLVGRWLVIVIIGTIVVWVIRKATRRKN